MQGSFFSPNLFDVQSLLTINHMITFDSLQGNCNRIVCMRLLQLQCFSIRTSEVSIGKDCIRKCLVQSQPQYIHKGRFPIFLAVTRFPKFIQHTAGEMIFWCMTLFTDRCILVRIIRCPFGNVSNVMQSGPMFMIKFMSADWASIIIFGKYVGFQIFITIHPALLIFLSMNFRIHHVLNIKASRLND